jgi:hypothetical protein
MEIGLATYFEVVKLRDKILILDFLDDNLCHAFNNLV